MIQRRRLRVEGTVQGVGFRPFVAGLADRLSITGSVGNDDLGVWCEIQAPAEVLEDFAEALQNEAPPLARVDRVGVEEIEVVPDGSGFTIEASERAAGTAAISIPPDVAPCAACLAEIIDPLDRRYRYPFTCCTDCGPRYTVVRSMPYDRERTAMAEFPLCDDCRDEYDSPGNRRHHAQATCCPACGPAVNLVPTSAAGSSGPVWSTVGDLNGRPRDPIERAAAALADGSILAVKGAGGFQLLCRADDDAAVTRLRDGKQRDRKPFALLVADLEGARHLVDLDDVSARALTGPEAPIVLAPRIEPCAVAESVAPDTRLLGVMLPATPVHWLLSQACAAPLVCTSGNHTDDPIIIDDTEAFERLGGTADAILTHDRPIERRADDSVGRATNHRFQLLRRARGFAPRPVRIGGAGPPVLAVGAELKSTVCLALGGDAHLSVHLGDLAHLATLEAFERAIEDLLAITRSDPRLVVHDAHPEYLSSKYAAAQDLAPTMAVQHHHAHLVACLADNGHPGPAIGVGFDGAGWGTDDTLWGGEFLIGDATGFRRAAHLAPVPVPGGAAAFRQPWRMLLAHLIGGGDGSEPAPDQLRLPALARHEADLAAVAALCGSGRSLLTSSMGRLFDAVCAVCDLVDVSHYEGEAAILLEQTAARSPGPPTGRYRWRLSGHQPVIADPAPLLQAIVDDRLRGVDRGLIAAEFHHAVAALIVDVCRLLRTETGLSAVAVSGGVFQNRYLCELAVPLLENEGFEVLRHGQVPPNDGGISLGQAVIGRAHLLRADDESGIGLGERSAVGSPNRVAE